MQSSASTFNWKRLCLSCHRSQVRKVHPDSFNFDERLQGCLISPTITCAHTHVCPTLFPLRSFLGHPIRHGSQDPRHVASSHGHLCQYPPPTGQLVTGSPWVPQSAAGPPLGGGAVADMKEAKAAMDWRTAWTVRFWGLGLTLWARGRHHHGHGRSTSSVATIPPLAPSRARTCSS